MREVVYGVCVGLIMGLVVSVAGTTLKVTVYGPGAAPRFCQSQVWYDAVKFICDN